MANNDDKNPISPEEYKNITEKMYKQNLELARLYKEVDSLNKSRESLVHLINHKVKGAFTHSKYIFAGILDGTFGDTNEEIRKRATQGLESDDMGIKTIDLFLNTDNLKKGTIKYDMKDTDFKDLILQTLAGKKVQAEARGLQMESIIDDGAYHVSGDVFWLREAVNNLIDNSIKYTKEGKITVDLKDGNGQVKLSVKDTGIGIADEDRKTMFTEGGRGQNSVKINVDSTGYGLYTVKLVIEAHGGKVWVESEGEGKGSTFYIELSSISENKLS
ncbi:MAG: HAMP domain-containing sensor histidine kinase [Patescibacteria group bacterium]